jgi:LuxR family maltose regulon positive regulatory protein
LPVPLATWKSALIGDLELLEATPFILALDDYQFVGNPSIDLLLTDLLQYEQLPLHLILSARRRPSLAFSRLKVQGKVVEIKAADLRFTDAEAMAYFRHTTSVPWSASEINQLQEKTEGWAAGLALAAISIREAGQAQEFLTHLKTLDGVVIDYLLDQAFNNQTDEIREFLLKTATFSQFCTSMLWEVFDFKQSENEIQTLLEQLEAAQLFLIPLDNQRFYYRYHHLFRQMLLSRQRYHVPPDQIALYHRRAAAWLIRQGQTDEALNQLTAIQDWVGAAQVLESQLCLLLNAEDFLGIKSRLEYFPEDFIATRPGLLLMKAWLAHYALRYILMHSLTAKIQVMLDAALQRNHPSENGAPLPGFEILPHSIVQAQVWELESIYYYLINQGDQAMSLARQAVDMLPETWLFARGNAIVYLGLSMFMEGQYHQTVDMLLQLYEQLQDPSSTYGAWLLFCLSVVHLLHGELELSRQTAEQMIRAALANNLLLMQGWGYYLLGRIYQEWNQLELAASYYERLVDQRFTWNLFTSLESIASHVLVLQTLDRHKQAKESLDLLQQLYSDQTPALPPAVMSLIAWLDLQNGNREEARRWAESFNAPVAEQAIVWHHIPHIYKAKILMEIGGPETDQAVDQLLDEIQELAERTHNNLTLLRVLAMRAVWLVRQGKSAAALQTLECALRLARTGRFIRTFVEQGPDMLELLRTISTRLKNVAGLSEYVETIIAAFLTPKAPHPAPPKPPEIKTLLTERELEVLELLAERLSINEISARLCISPSTVQQHTHHIYRKLNVANKRQAVASAVELGILSPIASPGFSHLSDQIDQK